MSSEETKIIKPIDLQHYGIHEHEEFFDFHEMQEFAYIINLGGDYYKIGFTRNINQRLRAFMKTNPFFADLSQIVLLVHPEWLAEERQFWRRGSGPYRPIKRFRGSSYHGSDARWIEKKCHKWCIEKGYNYDSLRACEGLSSEIFKLSQSALKELLEYMQKEGVAFLHHLQVRELACDGEDEHYDAVPGRGGRSGRPLLNLLEHRKEIRQ
jgi:hypothetical protein